MLSFYEFFAGGGMVRAGLGLGWKCLFANDFDHKKGEIYTRNWGGEALQLSDIRDIVVGDLPSTPDLVWGSFPCQDLSLAGGGAGLRGERSGTFFPFWDIINDLIADGRGPKIIALENVCGALTSNSGQDFAAICKTFANAGYRYGALVINASLFLPQSRPRLFVIGVRGDIDLAPNLTSGTPDKLFHTAGLRRAIDLLPSEAKSKLVWWNIAPPTKRKSNFADIIEENPTTVRWHTESETNQLMSMMSPTNLAKVELAKTAGVLKVGGIYRRTRVDGVGRKTQRAEVRFDDISGCLRTPAGGSSRQIVMLVAGESVKTRLISPRETARLMGLDDSYELPSNYNDAYHLTGDGVAVDVVSYLRRKIFEPILRGIDQKKLAA
jgi:DNA (cytosine-5)-methyltransferase 1